MEKDQRGEFIPDAVTAIMELIDANDLLDEAGIEVTSVSCAVGRPEDPTEHAKLTH